MNPKTWFLLIVALVCGVGAAFCVKSIFFAEPTEQVADENAGFGTKERTLVANFDLPSGAELTAQNVRFALLPESQIPREAVTSFEGVAGRKTLNEIKAGTPITLYDLVLDEETDAAQTTFVPPGYSIVPIEIQTAFSARGGRNFLKTTPLDRMLKAGDVVDLAVVKEDSVAETSDSALGAATVRRPRLTTTRIVEDVDVFSVSDEKTFATDDGAQKRVSIVSVLLSAEQREIVSKASEEGKIKVLSGDAENESFDGSNALDLTSVLANPNSNANLRSGETTFDQSAAPTADALPIEIPMNADVAFPALDAAVAENQEEAKPQNTTEDAARIDAPQGESETPFNLLSDEIESKPKTPKSEPRFDETPLGEIAESAVELNLNLSTDAAPTVRFRERVPNAGIADFVEVSAPKTSNEAKRDAENVRLPQTSAADAKSKSLGSVQIKPPAPAASVEKAAAPAKKFNLYSPFVTKTSTTAKETR